MYPFQRPSQHFLPKLKLPCYFSSIFQPEMLKSVFIQKNQLLSSLQKCLDIIIDLMTLIEPYAMSRYCNSRRGLVIVWFCHADNDSLIKEKVVSACYKDFVIFKERDRASCFLLQWY